MRTRCALADFDHALSRDSGQMEFSLRKERASCYVAMTQFDRAIAELTELIERNPEGGDLYQRRAQAYQGKHEIGLAIADCDRAVELSPDDPGPYFYRLILLYMREEYDRFQADLDRLVQRYPKEWGPYVFRAVGMSLARQDWDRAIADMDKTLAIQPTYSPFYLFRAFLHTKEARIVPICRDLAAFFLTLDQIQFHFYVRLLPRTETKPSRWEFRMTCECKNHPTNPRPSAPKSDINTQCIELGIERLASATFGLSH